MNSRIEAFATKDSCSLFFGDFGTNLANFFGNKYWLADLEKYATSKGRIQEKIVNAISAQALSIVEWTTFKDAVKQHYSFELPDELFPGNIPDGIMLRLQNGVIVPHANR